MLVVLDHVILGQRETVSRCYIKNITVLWWLREIQGSPNGEDCDTNHCCLKTVSPAVGMFWDIASIWVLLKTKYTSIKQQQVSYSKMTLGAWQWVQATDSASKVPRYQINQACARTSCTLSYSVHGEYTTEPTGPKGLPETFLLSSTAVQFTEEGNKPQV